MKHVQSLLTRGFVFTTLVLFAFLWITLASGRVFFLYREITAFNTASTIAHIAALMSLICVFAAGTVIAITAALQPGNWLRKVFFVLPSYLLGWTLIGIFLNLSNIGTVGTLFAIPLVGRFTFATLWLTVSAVLSAIAIVRVATHCVLSPQSLKTLYRILVLANLAGFVAWSAMAFSSVALLTLQPPVPPGSPAPFQTTGLSTPFIIGVVLMTIFLALGVFTLARMRIALKQFGSEETLAQIPSAEARRAVSIGFILVVLSFVVMQAVPVERTSAPSSAEIHWDSSQTKDLWSRACMDCHSTETRWPWYSYVAPVSWLIASHVAVGREEFDISEALELPETRKIRLLENLARLVRSGIMPPSDYLLMHPEARLSSTEKEALIEGLRKSLTE